MEQTLLVYGLPKETITAIITLYSIAEVKVRSPDGDTDFFDFVAGVLPENTFALYLLMICIDYDRSNERK